MFRKVLVANRGEIAVRIIRALKEMGIRSVAVFSDADRAALHVLMADEAVPIGPAPSIESYLCIPKIIEAARRTASDAIHPGYGFLSENAEFASACATAGIAFVGPTPAAIRAMGSKVEARRLAQRAGVPVVPGTEGPVSDTAAALAAAKEIGFPVLLKASAGGGGKGMRLVSSEGELASALRDAASESERAFQNAEIYIERALLRPRHIEIQVLGDQHGNLIHLGERECSIQRRHQKVIEECPSPLLSTMPELRDRMGDAAIRAARAAGYHNAGTVEFLVDSEGRYYFLEMNTRLQVEHPVTELVTSTDLVHWQLRIAMGETLALRQEDIRWRGSAIECRIYAEDPENQFFPSPGQIVQYTAASGPGTRLDSGIYAGWTVPMEYDPLLAKLAAWAETREAAIQRMIRALGEMRIAGITTNISFFRELFDDAEFKAGRIDTGFLEDYIQRRPGKDRPDEAAAIAAVVAAVHQNRHGSRNAPALSSPASRWREGRESLFR